MSKKSHSARKLFSPENSPDRNFGIALFGDAVWTERQVAILKVVGLFENVADWKEKERKRSLPFCERQFDSIARPLLLKALSEQDPEPFREFVAAFEAARRIKESREPVHPLEAAILRLEFERSRNRARKKEIREQTDELCKKLLNGVDPAQVRRAVKLLGVPYKSGKRGRPLADD